MRVLGQEALAFSRARPGSGAAFLSELWRRTERASEGVCELTFFYGCTCCGRAAPAPSRRGRPRERGRGVEGGASSSSCVRVCRSEHAPREIKRSFSPPAHARHLLPRATARSRGAACAFKQRRPSSPRPLRGTWGTSTRPQRRLRTRIGGDRARSQLPSGARDRRRTRRRRSPPERWATAAALPPAAVASCWGPAVSLASPAPRAARPCALVAEARPEHGAE